MAFAKKTWKDRIAEFPTRRRLTKEDNTSELVTVAREEGTLSQEGDAFSAENMNDLESRIDAEFTEVNGNLNLIDISEIITGANITPFYMYKIGRIVYFSVNVLGVTINANSGVSRSFISGNYPKQLTAISVFATKNNAPTNVQAAINTDGSLVLRSNTAVSNDYVVSGFYVSK